jgi:hypothetical protein
LWCGHIRPSFTWTRYAWLVKDINWNIPAFFYDVNFKMYIGFCFALQLYTIPIVWIDF